MQGISTFFNKRTVTLIFFSALFLPVVLLPGCAACDDNLESDIEIESYKKHITKEVLSRYKTDIKEGVNAAQIKKKAKYADIQPLQIDDMWWNKKVHDNFYSDKLIGKAGLENSYLMALFHSKQIKVFSDMPVLRWTSIEEARGEFDPKFFVEGSYAKTKEPVGSTLKTGKDGLFKEEELKLEVGIQKKFITGTQVTLSQKLTHINNNSEYMVPNPQGLASLVVTVVQPVLQGAGIRYNQSAIKIAKIDTAIAKQELKRQLQSHLSELTRVYWALYLARIQYLIRQHTLEKIAKIAKEMKERKNIDVIKSQIYRTEAALADHKAKLIRAKVAIQNTQDRFVSLINDPELEVLKEIIPVDSPITTYSTATLANAVQTAIKMRPEIQQAVYKIHAGKVRLGMSRNELLPLLDVTFEAGLYRLRDEGDAFGAMSDEFDTEADPGFKIGFRLEFPLGNRRARARHLRNKIEMRQLMNQLKTTLESIIFEVKVSLREVDTAYEEFIAKQKVFMAAKKEFKALEERRVLETILDGKRNTSSYLELLLDSIGRVAGAEYSMIKSLIDYNMAIVNLRRVQGSLLEYHGVEGHEILDQDNIPLVRLITKHYKQKLENEAKKGNF